MERHFEVASVLLLAGPDSGADSFGETLRALRKEHGSRIPQSTVTEILEGTEEEQARLKALNRAYDERYEQAERLLGAIERQKAWPTLG